MTWLPILATAQSHPAMTAYQFSQIFGWQSGDRRSVDVVSEMTANAYNAFWAMNADNRQIAFNSLSWPVVTTLITMHLSNLLAPADQQKRAAQTYLRAQYANLIDLIASRYSLSLGSGDLNSGMMYFIELLKPDEHTQILQLTCLIDNIARLKPNSPVDLPEELKQQVIRISQDGSTKYNEVHGHLELNNQQIVLRDFLFR